MNLPISVWSSYFVALSPEEMVDAFAEAGLGCTELSIEHGKMLLKRSGKAEVIGKAFGEYAAQHGFALPQGHLDMDLELTESRDLDMLKTWIDLFYAVGVRNMVLHATGAYDEPYEKQLELRGRAVEALARHVAGTDAVICLENLFSKPMVRTADGLNALIEAAGGGENLGICLDIGHLHRVRSHSLSSDSSADFIRKAGKRLKALHVHDNMGDKDDHLLPFAKNGLDWKLFMSALKENGFAGIFNLELPGENGAPLPLLKKKLSYCKEVAKYLLDDAFIQGA